MKATKYAVMNSITGLLLKWWSENSLTANIFIAEKNLQQYKTKEYT